MRPKRGSRDGFSRGRPVDLSISQALPIIFAGATRPTDAAPSWLAFFSPIWRIPPGLLITGSSFLRLEEVDIQCNLAQFGAVSGAPLSTGGSATGPADLKSAPLADGNAANDNSRAEKAFLDTVAVLDREIEFLFFLQDCLGVLTSVNCAWGPERKGVF